MGDYGGEFSAGRETIQGGAEKDTGCLLVNHLYGYRAHGELMAFLAVWEFDTFLFVEHFAVRKSCRNGGLGAVLLTQLTAQCRRPVILEVELPTGELEARRIAFYERNGFVMNPFEYMQPAMGEDRHAIPLRIMSYPKRLLADEFETMRDVLYCHVYRQK